MEIKEFLSYASLPIFGGTVFFIVGLILAIISTKHNKLKQSSSTIEIEGVLVGYDRRRLGHEIDRNPPYNFPVYEYELDGQIHRHYTRAGVTNDLRKPIGTKVKLYYDSNSGKVIAESSIKIIKILGICFLIAGIFFAIGMPLFILWIEANF